LFYFIFAFSSYFFSFFLDHPHSSSSISSFKTEYYILVIKILSFIFTSLAFIILYISFHPNNWSHTDTLSPSLLTPPTSILLLAPPPCLSLLLCSLSADEEGEAQAGLTSSIHSFATPQTTPFASRASAARAEQRLRQWRRAKQGYRKG
jgi:hypothetical protein